MPARPVTKSWIHALRQASVWRAAWPLGLSVGLLQVAVNQGDHWLAREITTGVVFKSILAPVISVSVAVLSAARHHRFNTPTSTHE